MFAKVPYAIKPNNHRSHSSSDSQILAHTQCMCVWLSKGEVSLGLRILPTAIFMQWDLAKRLLPQIGSVLIYVLLKWILSSASDDLDVAYQKLSKLIREYLGFSEATAMSLAPTTGTVLSLLCQNLVCFERKTNLWAVIWGLINQANASLFVFFKETNLSVYLAVPDLMCGTWDL